MKKRLIRMIAGVLCLFTIVMALASCSFLDNLFGALNGQDDSLEGGEGGTGSSSGGDESDEYGDLPTSNIAINEVSSNNTRIAAPDGGKHDWIELYNQTNKDIDLEGYGISDDKNEIKHVFQKGITVPAKGHLVLWACGLDHMSGKAEGAVYLPFSVSSKGEDLYLFSPRGAVIDEMNVPPLDENITYGYTLDCQGVLARMSGSIGIPNEEGRVMQLDASVASFSHESGFYDGTFRLKITLPEGYTAYYTLDCTTPTKESKVFPQEGITIRDVSSNDNVYSNLYTGNIDQTYKGYTMTQLPDDPVDKCSVLRVVVYENATNKCTDTITKSYFVGYNIKSGYENTAIISLVSEPDLLYGTDGLFTNSANWTKGVGVIEHLTNFTYFTNEHTYLFDQDIGIRLHGTSTRAHNQKSLTLFARQKYGSNVFEEAVVGDVKECHSMVLRTDGTTKIQEGFAQSLVSDRELSTCDYEPVVVFVDGEYAGVYNLYERFSGHYVESHYGIDDDNVYIVKKGSEENVSGALDAYNEFYNLMLGGDLTNPITYARLESMVDLQSLADLLAVHIYLCNADFSFKQNIAAWRAIDTSIEDPNNPYADGRWRFVLYDLDIAAGAWKPSVNFAGLGGANRYSCTASTNGFTQPSIWADAGRGIIRLDPVVNLLTSGEFKTLFIKTFYELLTVNFDSERVLAKLDAELDRYEPLMTKHFARWGIPVDAYEEGSKEGSNEASWKIKSYYGGIPFGNSITGMTWRRVMKYAEEFYGKHTAYALEDLEQYFSLNTQKQEITVTINDVAGGKVYLNGTAKLRFDETGVWTGTFPTAYLYSFSADAKKGYTFLGFVVTGDAQVVTNGDGSITIQSVTGAFTVTAQFSQVSGG